MKVTGIVTEFNPLHNGHVFMMREARRLTSADVVVVAMSGNFVQRGEPAILNKWSRTRSALLNGADLVLEIPTFFCLNHAGAFASAGVDILESLGCTDHICCGIAPGDERAIKETAGIIGDNIQEIKRRISERTGEGLSYPASREKAVLSMMETAADRDAIAKAIRDPNNILAIEYMLAANEAELLCIPRRGAAYNDDFSSEKEYQSAGGLRNIIREKGLDDAYDTIVSFVPAETADELKTNRLVSKDDISDYLRYSIINSSASCIDECPSGGEGLGNLIKEAAVSSKSTDDIISRAKSKRYTYTRISRLCMQILLGIDRRVYSFDKPEYIRVLGFNGRGRDLLSYVKRKDIARLPIITNINKERFEKGSSADKMIMLDIKASDIYNLICGNDMQAYSDKKLTPMIVGN